MKSQKSKLDPHAEKLDEWFGVEKVTLEVARDRLKALGCSVSLSRLSSWLEQREQARMQERLLGQITSGARHCQDIEKRFAANAAPELDTLVKLHRVLILQLTTQASADPGMLELVSGAMKHVLEYAKLQTKQQEYELSRSKFQRETCELFLKWYHDAKAREIAENPKTPHKDKLESLGKQMFGELW